MTQKYALLKFVLRFYLRSKLKFEFEPNVTNTTDLILYLHELYEGQEPIYFCPEHSLIECLEQYFKLTLSLHQFIRYMQHPGANDLSDRVVVLYQNITHHVNNFTSYSKQEQANINEICNSGKKHFETICYIFTSAEEKTEQLIAIISDMLYSEQLEVCMGGVLTVFNNAYYALTDNFHGLVQHICATKIQYDAQAYINQYNLLTLTNAGQIETTRLKNPAIHTEVHFINLLYNKVAKRCTWLRQVDDAYMNLYNMFTEWIDKFDAKFNENLLIEHFIQWFINDLPPCPKSFELAAYQDICFRLDLLGDDHTFSLYDPSDDTLPLKPNHETIIRASIIKRLLAEGILKLEPHELQCGTNVNNIKYNIYLIGDKTKHWVEWLNNYGETGAFNLNDTLPLELVNALLGLKGTPTCVHESLLLTSAANDNTKLLNSMLNTGINPNIQDPNKMNALLIAAQHGAITALKYLLEHKRVDVNLQDNNGDTALMLLVKQNNIAGVSCILQDKRVKINIRNNLGRTALMQAAEDDNILIMREILLQTHCGLNLQDNNGYTALMHAVSANKIKAVMLLLGQLDIDSSCQSSAGNTALIIAAAYNFTDIVMQLLARPNNNINHKNLHGKTAIMYAVKRMNLEVVDLLLLDQYGINLFSCDYKGRTVLSIAQKMENTQIIFKLERKTSPKHSNHKSNTCRVS